MQRLRMEVTARMAVVIRGAVGTRMGADTLEAAGHTAARFVEAAAPTE
jgi:hypothetical protein